MNQTTREPAIVACCGLVCGECGAYRKQKCQGCHSDKPLFANCPVKRCVKEKKTDTCAACGDFSNLHDCRKLNTFISKIFGFIFRSDRIGNLETIRRDGLEAFKNQI